MASARLVLEKLRSSDGRIRIKTLSGDGEMPAGGLLTRVERLSDERPGLGKREVHSPIIVRFPPARA